MKVFAQEPLDAMATVGRDYSVPMVVTVNPDPRRVGNEYFKIFNSDTFVGADKVARILFRKAEYVTHKDSKKPWILNSKEKRALVNFLKSKSDKIGLTDYTNWQVAILQFNEEKGLDQKKDFRKRG